MNEQTPLTLEEKKQGAVGGIFLVLFVLFWVVFNFWAGLILAVIGATATAKILDKKFVLATCIVLFGMVLFAGLLPESDSDGVSSDVKSSTQGEEASIADYADKTDSSETQPTEEISEATHDISANGDTTSISSNSEKETGGQSEKTPKIMTEEEMRKLVNEAARELDPDGVYEDTSGQRKSYLDKWRKTPGKPRSWSKTIADDFAEIVQKRYNIEVKSMFHQDEFDLCREDGGYCEFFADVFQIQIHQYDPYAYINVLTSIRSPHRNYRKMCAAFFSVTTGASIDFAEEMIEDAFAEAAQSGKVELELGNTKLTIEPSLGSPHLLACRFMVKWRPFSH